MRKKETSNKAILVLAVVVVLIVASCSWLVLTRLNSLQDFTAKSPASQQKSYIPVDNGKVSIAILPAEEGK